MIQEKQKASAIPKKMSSARVRNLTNRRWHRLCELYLPVDSPETVWRLSREAFETEPSQGWKLHLSATILEACDLFEKVAPLLTARNIQFKAPNSIEELVKINCGLEYGYWQVGKFITVYPSTLVEAVNLAEQLHDLTQAFTPVSIPFDNQYLPGSSVFYRYGAFKELEMTDEDGEIVSAIRDANGEPVYDNRLQPVPDWITDLFPKSNVECKEIESPLGKTYRVFRAVAQRGKGGTYQALDISENPPRFCIIKEGRKNGELDWSGRDGYKLVKNEFKVLKALNKIYQDVPRVYSFFESGGNAYLAMEFIAGENLFDLMKMRRRRYSIKKILSFAVEIAGIIARIHQIGWVWNDCKPANLIFTRAKSLKPIDFEGSYPINRIDPFEWKTNFFSIPTANRTSYLNDIYSLGSVVYFLLTGKFYDPKQPVKINELRRNVPEKFRTLTENLLVSFGEKNAGLSAAKIKKEFETISAALLNSD